MSDTDQSKSSLISEDLIIDGNLNSKGTVLVHGTVNGNISAETMTLAKSGKVKGKVTSTSTEMMGSQKGKIVTKTLKIVAGAQVNGDIKCEDISVESGAHISGKFLVKPTKP